MQREGDQCPHCYLSLWWFKSYHVLLSDHIQKPSGKWPQGSQTRKKKSQKCSHCLKFGSHNAVKTVFSMSVSQFIKQSRYFQKREDRKERGLGDTQEENVYVITPKQQDHIVKLVGRKFLIQCYLNDKPVQVLLTRGYKCLYQQQKISQRFYYDQLK